MYLKKWYKAMPRRRYGLKATQIFYFISIDERISLVLGGVLYDKVAIVASLGKDLVSCPSTS